MKICPLLSKNLTVSEDGNIVGAINCLEDKCALYLSSKVDTDTGCAFKVTAENLVVGLTIDGKIEADVSGGVNTYNI